MGFHQSTQTQRILRIATRLVQGASADVRRLSEEFGVHPRTIRRDLGKLEDAGVPLTIEERAGRPVRRLMAGSYPIAQINLSPEEAAAVELAAGQWAESMLPLGQVANAATGKLAQAARAAPASARNPLSGARTAYASLVRGRKLYCGPQNDTVLLLLLEAILRRRTCRVDYRAVREGQLQEAKQRTIEPKRILEVNGAVYCLAVIPPHENLATLALERMTNLELGDEPQRELAEPSISEHQRTEERFGVFWEPPFSVVLRIDRSIALYIRERLWHPTQEFIERADDGLEMRFTAGGTVEIVRWILGWGEGVEVIEPEWLRAKVVACLEDTLQRYRGPTDD